MSFLLYISWFMLGKHTGVQSLGCKVKVLAAQSCPTLCDPMDYILPASSVREILQARILERGVAFPFSKGFSNLDIQSGSLALQAHSLPSEPLKTQGS